MTGSTDAEDAAVAGERDGRNADEPEAGSGRVARAISRVLRGLGVAVSGVLVAVVLLVAALQIDPVSGFVARSAAGLVSGDSLRIRIGGASGSWIGGIRLTDLEMSGGIETDPAWSFSLDTLSADYRLVSLLRGRPHVTRLDATGVTVGASLGGDRGGEGEEEGGSGGLPFPIRVDSAEVGVRSVALTRVGVDSEPWRLSDGRVRLHGLALSDDSSRVALDTLTASFRPPGRPAGWGSLAAAGTLEGDRVRIGRIDLRSPESEVDIRGTAPTSWAGTAPDGLDLDLSLAPLHLADIGPFLPGTVSDSLHLRGDGTLRTRGDTLLVQLDAEADVPGSLQLDARVSGSRSSPDVGGTAEVSSLDLAAWGLGPRALVVDGSARFDLSRVTGDSIHGTASIEAGIDERDGPLRGRGTLEAAADSAGASWQADWGWSGMGLDVNGDAELLLDDDPAWSVAAEMAWDRPEAGDAEANDARGAIPTLTTVAASLDASGRGLSPDSLVGSADIRLDS
ncbi:MAG TPA: hypothetical protein VJ925_08360, partial [Longimicrobiales bacterium]|nr:hypothetical protein [Longimicrobiales bacterium]